MKPAAEYFRELMKDETFRTWYYSRPAPIRAMAEKYPWETYRIKEGAPYAISAPGSKVSLQAYNESGMIRVALLAEDILPAAVAHIKELLKEHGHEENDFLFKGQPRSGHSILVDPQWLEPIEE